MSSVIRTSTDRGLPPVGVLGAQRVPEVCNRLVPVGARERYITITSPVQTDLIHIVLEQLRPPRAAGAARSCA
ncbi:MAG TPA: hypothetical protein VK585_00135 [Jiangellaceae bacterium]|nr:hypothetical protein [Jiangellaceae bacterium]